MGLVMQLTNATTATSSTSGTMQITGGLAVSSNIIIGGTIAGTTINSSTLTASTLIAADSSKNIVSLATSAYPSLTELSYVKGLTSSAQTQITTKEPAITVGTSSQYWRGDKTFQTLNQAAVSGLTISDTPHFTNLVLDVAPTSSTTNYVSGLTIGDNTTTGGQQSNLYFKSHNDSGSGNNSRNWTISVGGNYNTPGFAGFGTQGIHDICFFDNGALKMQYNSGNGFYIVDPIVNPSLTASTILGADSSQKIVSLSTSTYPSLTELSYVKGLTSSAQTQITTKEPAITAGTSSQYYRGDKTFQTLNQAAVSGLTTSDSPTFTGITSSSLLTVNGAYKVHLTLISSTPYICSTTETVLLSHVVSLASTITLPSAASSTGRVLYIKDQGGRSNSYNIVISTAAGGENIDGNRTYTLSVNYGSLTIICDGSNWFII